MRAFVAVIAGATTLISLYVWVYGTYDSYLLALHRSGSAVAKSAQMQLCDLR